MKIKFALASVLLSLPASVLATQPNSQIFVTEPVPAVGQPGTAVEHADVVQAQESSLKNIVTLGILFVNPPGEIQQ